MAASGDACITLDMLKQHLRVTIADEDDLIALYLETAQHLVIGGPVIYEIVYIYLAADTSGPPTEFVPADRTETYRRNANLLAPLLAPSRSFLFESRL